ncbi:MAG: sensor histidine kinase, partial [Chitinophagaceae bacterium]
YKQKRKANILITQRNEQLGQLVKEKEWLVKEVHHRVKNNLQMVISLLNSQSAYLDDDAAVLAITDSQRRMHAMSLIHHRLYQSENVSVIDMRAYIDELINYLKDIYDTGAGIRFELGIQQVNLDVSQAVPVGLILNEVITNSIKYAFVNKSNGLIRVSLQAPDSHHLNLTVSDNGMGLPKSFDVFASKSLGMSLITGLVSQLEGTVEFRNEAGLKMTMIFPYEKNVMDMKTKTVA